MARGCLKQRFHDHRWVRNLGIIVTLMPHQRFKEEVDKYLTGESEASELTYFKLYRCCCFRCCVCFAFCRPAIDNSFWQRRARAQRHEPLDKNPAGATARRGLPTAKPADSGARWLAVPGLRVAGQSRGPPSPVPESPRLGCGGKPHYLMRRLSQAKPRDTSATDARVLTAVGAAEAQSSR